MNLPKERLLLFLHVLKHLFAGHRQEEATAGIAGLASYRTTYLGCSCGRAFYETRPDWMNNTNVGRV